MRCHGWQAICLACYFCSLTPCLAPAQQLGAAPTSPALNSPTATGPGQPVAPAGAGTLSRLPRPDVDIPVDNRNSPAAAADLAEMQRRLAAMDAELDELRADHERILAQAWPGSPVKRRDPSAAPQDAPSETGTEDRIASFEKAVNSVKNAFPNTRLSGFFQLDTGAFSQTPASRAELGDIQNGTGFRRAGLQAIGKVGEFTSYSLEVDFAFPGHPSFMDVWGEQTNLPSGTIRVGQYRQPVTMDSWTSTRHLEFLERSAPFIAFDPFRRVGVMDLWNSEDRNTLLAASVFASGWTYSTADGTVYNTLGGDNRFGTEIGNNGGVGIAGRGSHLLYYDEPTDGRYLLHIGGGYTFATIGGNGVGAPVAGSQCYEAASIPEFFVGDQASSISTFSGTPNVLDTGRFLARNYSLYHAELAGNAGSYHWQTEWLGTAVEQYGGPLVFYDGAYAQCGYFLTGESAGYNKAMGALDYNCKPFCELLGLGNGRRMCGWGAWEVAARWSYLDLQTNRINPLNYQGAGAINPATGLPVGLTAGNGGAGPSPANPNPGVLNESTVALNWYWNQYTRVQFNWIHNMLSSQYHGYSQMDAWTARYQVEF